MAKNDFDFDDFDFGEILKDDKKPELGFVKRGDAGGKVFDFTNVDSRNLLCKYDIMKDSRIKIPNEGEGVFAITTKPVSMLDILNYIENELGAINEAIMMLFTVNEKAAKYIEALSQRAKLKIVISDIMNTRREKELVITNIIRNSNVKWCFCHSHAKVVSFRIGERKFTLQGSMNAGTNAKIENVMIVGSSEMYGFVESTFGMLYEKFRREPLKEFRQVSI